ncbi:glycosyltransferase [Companilactobacillus sp.]|jgi:hypothetical protein|uniref:glycosyltransferase n=1 Tax=Companilactobacillus sp. TaxID=2767905 RepID=UPI0025C24589|nr:glycosyltransferase [Companilactobacillus sp.]MCH4009369.1 glycosyltransferase [Companilactobacillus sp.]MCH4050452.1 glycosyltransferase [Companilactobacillus sp.]MCH4077311.1 glycosyltransferase [Companilactobacillus sp.]MCH4125887.1 glycosyltransferase [Companilactobacillus sp.]MCI1311596.1 glycosyltransferase [Companilactobacillus sp.]
MLILEIILGISFFATLFTFALSIATFFFPVRESTPDKFLSDYKVYILMPVLNESSVIQDTVERFFNDSYYSYKNNVHLVLIDDRSTDGSTTILQKLNQRFHNFHVIKRKFPIAQHGKGEALNAGIQYVKEYNIANGILTKLLSELSMLMHQCQSSISTKWSMFLTKTKNSPWPKAA